MDDQLTRAGHKIEKLKLQLRAAEKRNRDYVTQINSLHSLLIDAIKDEEGWLERALTSVPAHMKEELVNANKPNS